MKRWLWLLLVLLCPAWAQADIEINERYERGEKIIGKVIPTNLPENAMMRGMFRVSGKASTWQPDAKVLEYAIWAEDGQHTVTAVGTWVVTDTGELGGALIDFGYYEYTATFIVGPGGPGPDPPPPPPPPPPVDQKWQVVMIHRSEKLSTLPLGQRTLLTSLKVRQNLKAKGHDVLEVLDNNVLAGGSPAKLRPFVNAVVKSGTELPVIAIAPLAGGTVQVYPLPADEAALTKLLGGGQ